MMKGCLCAQARKASRVLTQVYNRFLEPAGMPVTQYSLLANIRRLEHTTISELVDKMVLEKSTLTRNIAVLDKAGWIRQSEGLDRRTKVIELSATGQAALDRARPCWEQAQHHIAEKLGVAMAGQLFEDMGRVLKL